MFALYVDTGLTTGYSGSTVYPEDGDRMLLRKASKHLLQQIAANRKLSCTATFANFQTEQVNTNRKPL
jgi:hypothetical protein